MLNKKTGKRESKMIMVVLEEMYLQEIKGIDTQTDENHRDRHGEQEEYMPQYILIVFKNNPNTMQKSKINK